MLKRLKIVATNSSFFFCRSRGKQNDLHRRFQKYHSCHCNFTFVTLLSLSDRKLNALRVKTLSNYPLAWKILILSSGIFVSPLVEKNKYEALFIVGRNETLLNNNQCRFATICCSIYAGY